MSIVSAELLATIATLYGVGGALSILLQARRVVRRRTSADVSLPFLATYVGGYAIWLLYGVSIASVPIVLVHALGLLTGTVTLAVAVRYAGTPAPTVGSRSVPAMTSSRIWRSVVGRRPDFIPK